MVSCCCHPSITSPAHSLFVHRSALSSNTILQWAPSPPLVRRCRLPTTLLGMVDASVGIKVAINYKRKNGVGHFFSPLHTFIDKSFLGTLPLADVRSGVGEIMKAALIHDHRLYQLMEDHGEELIERRFQVAYPPVLSLVILCHSSDSCVVAFELP